MTCKFPPPDIEDLLMIFDIDVLILHAPHTHTHVLGVVIVVWADQVSTWNGRQA